MIRNTVIDHVVIPAAMDEAAAYLIVGTIAAIMFVGYHLTNRVEDRLAARKENRR